MNCLLKRKVDILTITESKLNSSFTTTQFLINSYSKPFTFDRNWNGGGRNIYWNLRKVKWLLFSTYHPPSESDDFYFSHVSNFLDAFSSIYDRFLLVDNLNAEDSGKTLFNLLEKHNAASIVKDKTWFKGLANPSCIHLFITYPTLMFSKYNCLFHRPIRFP